MDWNRTISAAWIRWRGPTRGCRSTWRTATGTSASCRNAEDARRPTQLKAAEPELNLCPQHERTLIKNLTFQHENKQYGLTGYGNRWGGGRQGDGLHTVRPT